MSMEHNLKEIIEELIQEVEHELDEATTTAGVDGYQTPFAFGNNRKKDKKKEKETATQAGYTIAEAITKISSPNFKKLEAGIKKINPRIKISLNPSAPGGFEIKIPDDNKWELHTDKVQQLVTKITGDHRNGRIFFEGIIQDREKQLKTLKQGAKVRGGGYGTFTKTGRDTFVSPKGKKYNSSSLIKLIGTFGDFKVNESVNEAKTYKKGDKLKIKLKNGKKFDVVFDSYSRTKGVALGKFKDGSGEYDTKPFDLDTIVESVNEAKVKRPVNRWLELKNDDTMHPHKKMAMGLKELKYQLREVEKFFSWYNKIKTMNELDSQNYWKRTNNHIYKIKERLINIAKTIKEIEK